MGEGRTNPTMGIHEHLPRLQHLGSTTAVQGLGQILNMTFCRQTSNNGCTSTHRVFSPRRNGALSALFSTPFVTSPHTITCAPPTTPISNQLLGNYFMALNSQLMCLPSVRTSGLGGSSWDTQISPLQPRRGPSSPDEPSKLTTQKC